MPKVVKASALAIKGLKPTTVEEDWRIEGHRGLYVRVYPSGHKSYFYRTCQDGKMNRLTLSAISLADATAEWASLRKREFQGGEDIVAATRSAKANAQKKRIKERSEPTIEVLAARYIAEHAKPKKRSWLQDEQRLARYVVPRWGSIKAIDISRADVQVLVAGLALKTPTLANRVLALVRKLFSFAVDSGVLTTHPCLRMTAPAAEKARKRTLNEREMKVFWRVTERRIWQRVIAPSLSTILRLQLLTGCRHAEIRGARWSELNLPRNEWLIPGERTKNKLDHLVPLTPLMTDMISTLSASPGNAFLFPWLGREGHVRADTLDRAVRDVCALLVRIDIEAFRPHDLRRTTETGLARLGIHRELRDRVLNHKDNSVSGKHYNAHDYKTEKRQALMQWEQELRSVVGLPPLRSKSAKDDA